jgi:hypothetical protein
MKSPTIMALLRANAYAKLPANIAEDLWPEVRLWRAVVLVALADLASPNKDVRRPAEEWIYGLPSTFTAICDMAALNNKEIRRIGGVILDGGEVNGEDAKDRAGRRPESVRGVGWLGGYEQFGRLVEALEELDVFDGEPVVPDLRDGRPIHSPPARPASSTTRAD